MKGQGDTIVASPWGQEALALVLKQGTSWFSANDLWKQGLSVPVNKMWLGNVLRHAHSTGLIRRVGHDRSDLTHGSVISKWVLASAYDASEVAA
jgi:hypothetical protein